MLFKKTSRIWNLGVIIMFVFGNLLVAIAKILDILLTLYFWIIIAQAVISWVRPDPYNPIVRFLYSVTEPVLRPIRRHLPVSWGGFDFSPLLILLAVFFLQEFLIKSLIQLGLRM
jgi:YggT family protein